MEKNLQGATGMPGGIDNTRVGHKLVSVLCASAMITSMMGMPANVAWADEGAGEAAAAVDGQTVESQDQNSVEGGGSENSTPASDGAYGYADEAAFLQWQAEQVEALVPAPAASAAAEAAPAVEAPTASAPQAAAPAAADIPMAASLEDYGTVIAPGATIGASGGAIVAGGTYVVDASSAGVVTVVADMVGDQPVVLTTNGKSVNTKVRFKTVSDSGAAASVHYVWDNFQVEMTANVTAYAMFDMGDNIATTVELRGDNAIDGSTFMGGNTLAKPHIDIRKGSSLHFTGTGSLYMEGGSKTKILIGCIGPYLNGDITFGEAGKPGPTVTLYSNGCKGIGWYSTQNANNNANGYAEAAAGVGVPGAITFESGSVNIAGTSNLIGGGSYKAIETCKNQVISVKKDATLNLSFNSAFGFTSPSSQVPVGTGMPEFSNASYASYTTYDPSDPATGGTMVVEDGAVVRCYYGGTTNANFLPTNQPFVKGYCPNIICMDIKNPSEQSLVGVVLDLDELGISTEGNVTYSIDGGEPRTYSPTEQGFKVAVCGEWFSSAMSSQKPESKLPLFLTPEKHKVTVNGVNLDLVYTFSAETGKTFAVGEASFAINYDLNDDDSQYKAENPDAIVSFKSSDAEFQLKEPTREGYTFDGWFDAQGNQVTAVSPAEVETDLSLTAHWSRVKLAVAYPHWEGGTETALVEYGRTVTLEGQVISDELKEAMTIPALDEQPEEGFTTIGYLATTDSDGNLSLEKRSGMPSLCKITITQPDADCPIWVVVGDQRYDSGTIVVPNGTKINLQAYPEDGYVFNNFCVDGAPLVDAEGNATFELTAKEHMEITADVRMVRYIKASIPADEGMTLVDGDANKGERISADGIKYQILKTGIRYVKGQPEYVKDYPVYNGDPLYEDDVVYCVGSIDDSVQPEDPNYAYAGAVRFAFNGGKLVDSVAQYRVVGDEALEGEAESEFQGGSLEITTAMPRLEVKNWLHVADTSWYNEEESLFTISTPEQLAGMSQLILDGKLFEGKTIVLANDISLANNDGTTGKRLWMSRDYESTWLAGFKGTFDGQGHTISGLRMEQYYPDTSTAGQEMYQGLFAMVDGGTVKNVTVEGDISLSTSGAKITYYTGLIAGYMREGAVIENCTARGSVTARQYTGGIVGYASSSDKPVKITNCRFEGEVKGNTNVGGIVGSVLGMSVKIEDCVNTGSISADGTPGGICGSISTSRNIVNNVSFANCMNTGDVTVLFSTTNAGLSKVGGGILALSSGQSTFTNCYNSGSIILQGGKTTTSSSIGGIVGYSGDMTMVNCANSGDILAVVEQSLTGERSRVAYAGGLVGQMTGSSETQPSVIDTCYNTGTVDVGYAGDGAYISESGQYTNPGMVSGAGGLVGATSPSLKGQLRISNSYSAGQLLWAEGANEDTGQPYVPGGLIGVQLGWGSKVYQQAPADTETAGIYLWNNSMLSGIAGSDTRVQEMSSEATARITLSGAASSRAYSYVNDRVIGRVAFTSIPTDGPTYVQGGVGGVVLEDSMVFQRDALIAGITNLKGSDGAVLYKVESDFNSGLPIFSGQYVVSFSVLRPDGSSLGHFSMLTGESLSPDAVTAKIGGEPRYEGSIPAGYSYWGYFDGYSTVEGSNVPMSSIVVTSGSPTKTLYAIFSGDPIVYNVNYLNVDGAQLDTDLTTFTVESPEQTLARVTPVREGDVFLGWYDGPDMQTANRVTSIPAGTLGDVNLYAHWKSEIPVDSGIRTITYHLNGGVNPAGAPTTFTMGTAVTLPTPSRSGYVFDGWYADASMSGPRVTSITAAATENAELWAGWVKVVIQEVPSAGSTGGNGSGSSTGSAAGNGSSGAASSGGSTVAAGNGGYPSAGAVASGGYTSAAGAGNAGGYTSAGGSTYSGSFSAGGATAANADGESGADGAAGSDADLADADLTSMQDKGLETVASAESLEALPETGNGFENIAEDANPLAGIEQQKGVFDWLPWVLTALFGAAAVAGWSLFGLRRKKNEQDQYGNVE